MWISFSKDGEITPEVFINCDSMFDSKEISPAYKLAKQYGIKEGKIFSIDNIFFALFFLQKIEELKHGFALIHYTNKPWYISAQQTHSFIQITQVVLDKKYPNQHVNWGINNFEELRTLKKKNSFSGKGIIMFENLGYITIETQS